MVSRKRVEKHVSPTSARRSLDQFSPSSFMVFQWCESTLLEDVAGGALPQFRHRQREFLLFVFLGLLKRRKTRFAKKWAESGLHLNWRQRHLVTGHFVGRNNVEKFMLPVICLDPYFLHSSLNLREPSCQLLDFESDFNYSILYCLESDSCESAKVPAQKALTLIRHFFKSSATSWKKESAFAPLPRNIVKRRPSSSLWVALHSQKSFFSEEARQFRHFCASKCPKKNRSRFLHSLKTPRFEKSLFGFLHLETAEKKKNHSQILPFFHLQKLFACLLQPRHCTLLGTCSVFQCHFF